MADQIVQIRILDVRLEAQSMLEGYGEGDDHVQEGDLGEKILLLQVAFSLPDVYPDTACQSCRDSGELAPDFPSCCVAAVRGLSTHVERKTDEDAQRCNDDGTYLDW